MARTRRRDLDVAQLTRILEDDQACRDLQHYFGVGPGKGELPPSTGGRFELLDGGGDRAEVCNRFTASDIVALGLLSVQLPARVHSISSKAHWGKKPPRSLSGFLLQLTCGTRTRWS
jgi:hypothetical protein